MTVLKFKRHRTLAEIGPVALAKGLWVDSSRHDDEGSDWVSIGWVIHGEFLVLVYSVFNGRFIIEYDGAFYTEESQMDDCDWYQEILEFLYVPHDQEVAA
jgi:hypothetical protein